MGSGRWSHDAYDAAAAYRARTGRDAFDYDAGIRASRRRQDWTAHPDLDPYGVDVRESRDSAEHPESLAVAVLFDVTGSMGYVPRRLQEKLPQLFDLLLDRGYVAHPQLLFGAIGDATCDRVPLQIGQFESDNRMDEQLGRILLEGGGGGQKTESYELAAYFMARHTSIDCWEKRGKRGYLFIIGDELNYPRVYARGANAPVTGYDRGGRRGVAEVIGDRLQDDIDTRDIYAELREMYDTYYILPSGTSYAGDRQVLDHWRGLLGQNVIELDDLDAVSETIALTVGIGEGTIGLDDGLADLRQQGSTAGRSVERALATLAHPAPRDRAASGDRAAPHDRAASGDRVASRDGRGGDRGGRVPVARRSVTRRRDTRGARWV
ncbi:MULTISPECIES: hypothetical protein [Catenuloplanes]|uniref:Uncharacterized protein n=1 Tax=Catenuloplanes niger TaxID=587534 RepID=A0AAE3ZPG8_9ACTN|nr:hypothetical protein [Catenuloplanes niger]MDR7321878.1 hypothetical protein [Catenuloplanes niger]